MISSSSIIETGVDKLVKLIRERGRISVPDASHYINVSSSVISEWAEFLEEEGLIKIEYKFTKPYLVERKLTKKELEDKSKEFESKRETFIRKSEVSINFLEKQADALKNVKAEFDSLKQKFGFEIGTVKDDLAELDKYEQLRHKAVEELRQQREESRSNIAKIAEQIDKEQKKLQQLVEGVKQEEEIIKKEKEESVSVDEAEKEAYRKIEELKSTISSIEKKAREEDETIKLSEGRIEKMRKMIKDIAQDIEMEKSSLEPLIEKSKRSEETIEKIHQSIIKKLRENERKMDSSRDISKKIKVIFEEKLNAIELLESINKERDELEKEFVGLIKKARSLQLTSKSEDVGTQIVEIEKMFEEVNKKKNVFEEMYKKLISLIK